MDDKSNRRVALLAASLVSFLTPFIASSINVALPTISEEFSMSAIHLGWVATAYLLAAAVCMVPFGRIADLLGRKKIFFYGVLVYTAGSILCAISPSGTFLIASRALQGVGAAMTFGTAVAILTSVFPAEERGKVLGINVAAVYFGLSVGPFLGGLLTEHFGWRSIFYANVPVGLVILAILPRLRGEWADSRGQKFDFVGSAIYGLALALIMYGLSLLPTLSGILLITAGGLGIFAFLKWETKVGSPVLDISLFRNNTVFIFSSLAALINYSATFAVTFLLSLYLQYIKGLNPEGAGLILVSQPLMQAIFSPFAGRLSDKIEPGIVASTGMAFVCIGLLALSFVGSDTAMVWIVVWLALLGFGFAFFSSPNSNAIMSSVEKRLYGVGSATLATMRLLGQMLSMGIAMLVFAIFIGQVEIVPQYYAPFLVATKTAFLIFAALCFVGIFASLARGKVRQN